jgi:hypothetical protein
LKITRSCFRKGLKNLPNSLFYFFKKNLERSMQGIKFKFLSGGRIEDSKSNLKFQSATWHYFKQLQSKDIFFHYCLSFTTLELFCHNYMDRKNNPIVVHIFSCCHKLHKKIDYQLHQALMCPYPLHSTRQWRLLQTSKPIDITFSINSNPKRNVSQLGCDFVLFLLFLTLYFDWH